MSFQFQDDNIFSKYNEIWNDIKMTLNIKFHSQSISDQKYIKAKVRAFNDVTNTVFSDNEIPKERSLYTCIEAICIDFVLKIDKKTIFRFVWNSGNINKNGKSSRFYRC